MNLDCGMLYILSCGIEAECFKQGAVFLSVIVFCGQQGVAVKNRVCASKKAKRLHFIAHMLSTGRQAHHAVGHDDPCHSNCAYKFNGVKVRCIGQWRAGYTYELIDGQTCDGNTANNKGRILSEDLNTYRSELCDSLWLFGPGGSKSNRCSPTPQISERTNCEHN